MHKSEQITANTRPPMATAVLIRTVEERLLKLYGEGRLHGTVHTCIGQELTGVAVAMALRPGDHILSNHRGHGHYLAWTDDVEGLIAEIMGKEAGVCGGKGGSQHLCRDGFLSNGLIGGMAPVAAGLAYSHRLADDEAITVLFVGDGAMAQGVLFEALNHAAILGLPLLVVVEANGIAQSTPTESVQAGSIHGRAAAFGIEVDNADTWSPDSLFLTTKRAIDEVRLTQRPRMLVVSTFRLMSHSKGDDTRPDALIADFRQRDAVTRWIGEGTPESNLAVRSAAVRVDAAVDAADAAPPTQLKPISPASHSRPVALMPAPLAQGRLVDRIRAGIGRAMASDDRIILVGEDLEAPYGGAFKVSAELSDRFPGRVVNSAISEAGLVGLGTGLALGGFRPVVEIMFGDFLTLASDQLINHAAKFEWMYNQGVTVPLVVRTPMGGRRGYGPTHSQCLESHFLGVPGLQVAVVNHRVDAEALYARLPEIANAPLLLIENKVSYGADGVAGRIEGFSYLVSDEVLPTLVVRPTIPPILTLLCYGGMLDQAEQAADRLFNDHDIMVEIVCPMALYPFNYHPVLESLKQTERLLIAEEGQGFSSFGAEAAAALHEGMKDKPFKLRRLSAQPCPIPAAGDAENAALVNVDDIVAVALALTN